MEQETRTYKRKNAFGESEVFKITDIDKLDRVVYIHNKNVYISIDEFGHITIYRGNSLRIMKDNNEIETISLKQDIPSGVLNE